MGQFEFPTYCVTNQEIQTGPLPAADGRQNAVGATQEKAGPSAEGRAGARPTGRDDKMGAWRKL